MRLLRLVSAVLCVALCALPGAVLAKRVALVLGNAAYTSVTPLRNPLNDAEAMGEALERLGFEVTLVTDQTQLQTLEVIEGFIREAYEAEVALFYYSGHGLQLDGDNYLMPVDLEVTTMSSVQYRAVNLGHVLRDMEEVAQASIMILDACRDNPFESQIARLSPLTRSAGLQRGLQRMVPRGRRSLIAYAAAAGATAADGRGRHSPYTEALLDEIEEPGLEVGLMFRRVAGRVQDMTRDGQQPELLIRLPEEIYLAEAPAVDVSAPDVRAATLPEVAAEAQVEAEPVDDAPDVPEPLLLVDLPELQQAARGALAPDPLDVAPHQSWGYPRIEAGFAFSPRELWEPLAGQRLDEVEPNNSQAQPQPVQVMDKIRLSISPKGDEDWFRFTTGSAGVLHARIYDSPAELDMAGIVMDFNGSAITAWGTADRPGGVLDAAFPIPAAGVYMLRMKDSSSDASSDQMMELDLSFTAAADGFEPNGSMKDARPVPLDFEADAAVFPKGDVDYFRMNVTRPGVLDVVIEDVPETMDVFFMAQSLDRQSVSSWIGPKRDGGDTVGEVHFEKPGVYFLIVKDGSDDAFSAQNFRIETRFLEAEDAYEPNGSRVLAREIPADGAHRIAIFPKGDNDHLSFTVDHPGTFFFDVEDVPEVLDVFGQVTNLDGTAVSPWIGPKRDGGDTLGEVDIARPGRYFLRLKDGSDDATSWRGMTLNTRYQRAADQYEPNGTRALAKRLRLGGTVALNILPKGDEDYFAFNTDHSGALQIVIEDVDEALDVFVQAYDLDGTAISPWVGPKRNGGDTVAVIDVPRAGTYFLRLKDGSNDARAVAPFSMTTRFVPALDRFEPNGSRAQATLVEADGEGWFNIFPRGDNDFLYFHARGAGELDVLVDQVPKELDIYLQLIDARGSAISSWVGPSRVGGDTLGTVKVPGAGWYWLRVKDGSDDAHSIDPFRMTRRFRVDR